MAFAKREKTEKFSNDSFNDGRVLRRDNEEAGTYGSISFGSMAPGRTVAPKRS